jgi:hypothetical protein
MSNQKIDLLIEKTDADKENEEFFIVLIKTP